MARGYVYKRCRTHGNTGTPARGAKPPKPACRCKDGRWTWRAEGVVDSATGRRSRPSRGGFLTRDEAQERLTEYLAETGGGRQAYDRRMTVATWLRRWLADCKRRRLEPKTLAGYGGHVEMLIPLIGDVRVRDLRRHHVEAAMTALAQPVPLPEGARKGRRSAFVGQRRASTVNGIRRTLRAALSAAVRAELLADNPAAGRLDAIGKVGRTETTWWEPEQLQTFLEHVDGDDLATLWTVAAFTGLRRGELCGLPWAAVELDGDRPGLHVRQRVSGVNGPHPCPVCGKEHVGRVLRPLAKTEAGLRWVPLAPLAVAALRRQRQRQDAVREHLGDGYAEHGLVWALDHPDAGHPLRPGAVTSRHGELVRAAGLPPIRLHDMRHGAASLMLAAGMPVELVALILGHASPSVTRGVYAHTLKAPATTGIGAAQALVTGAGS